MTENPLGIMQGRLTPPVNGRIQAFPGDAWEDEFFQAKKLGLEMIDWIVESDNLHENPLISHKGEKKIKNIISTTGVRIGAVCADYFMDCPLVRCSDDELKERIQVLELLIHRLSHFGIKYLEIPFVDNSAIKNDVELKQIVRVVSPLLDTSFQSGVTLAFETSLPPKKFKSFLSDLDHPSARANYDMGNSASLGYDPREELAMYGDKVVTVHVKDRVHHGGTVPLGKGDTDFVGCFSMLRQMNYKGPFILQAARGNEEFEWTKKNIAFTKHLMQ